MPTPNLPALPSESGGQVDLKPWIDGTHYWATIAKPIVDEPDFRFVHHQSSPSSTWSITHNLDGYPSVTVVDSAGSVFEGRVVYIDRDNIQVSFTAAFSGEAYLS